MQVKDGVLSLDLNEGVDRHFAYDLRNLTINTQVGNTLPDIGIMTCAADPNACLGIPKVVGQDKEGSAITEDQEGGVVWVMTNYVAPAEARLANKDDSQQKSDLACLRSLLNGFAMNVRKEMLRRSTVDISVRHDNKAPAADAGSATVGDDEEAMGAVLSGSGI